MKFIGCSKWRATEQFEHRYAAIPAAVDEDVLGRYMAGTAVAPEDANQYDTHSCNSFMHPRHGKQKNCRTSHYHVLSHLLTLFPAHTHFRDDKLVVGSMIPYPCPVTKIVYTSKQPDFHVLVVIFRGSHSHPPWPLEKPGQAAKADVAKCLDAMGTFGTTGGKLNNCMRFLLFSP